MKKKQLGGLLAALWLAGLSCPTASAASGQEMFADVPQGHWAYDAVEGLADAGLVTGYGGKFHGDKLATRYQMARLVASAIAHESEAAPKDKATIERLRAEFTDEIGAMTKLGERVTALEKKTDHDIVKIHGFIEQEFSSEGHRDINGKKRTNWWAKELYLQPTVQIPKSDWSFHAQFVSKLGGERLGAEERIDNLWNGGTERDDGPLRPDLYWFEGSIPKTGLYAKIGDFSPFLQQGFVYNAYIKGIELDHWGQGYALHFLAGRPDSSNGDMTGNVGPTYNSDTGSWEKQAMNVWTDNVRAHENLYVVSDASTDWKPMLSRDGKTALSREEIKHLTENGGTGSENAYDYDHPDYGTGLGSYSSTGINTKKTLYAVAYDRFFNDRLSGSLGYYRYTSAAYNREPLHIGSATLAYKLAKNLTLQGIYAQGSQHGANSHNKGYMIDIFFRGTPWIPANTAHLFGAYIGYHYLAPDSYVRCGYGDGVEKGQKGIELGMYYNIAANVQFGLRYGRGQSLTAPDHKDRSKLASYVEAFF